MNSVKAWTNFWFGCVLFLVACGSAGVRSDRNPSSDPTPVHELQPRSDAGKAVSPCPVPAKGPNQLSLASDWPDFFKDHPLLGCLFSPEEEGYTPYPFQVFSGETNIYAGTSDLQHVTEKMSGSGYYPVRAIMPDGRARAYAYVFFNRPTGSNVGTYTEFFTFFAASTNPNTSLKATNGIAPIVALGLPGVVYYFDRAVLSNDNAIRYGRSLMGFNKTHGNVQFNEPGTMRDFVASEPSGLILHAQVKEDPADTPAAVRDGLIPTLVDNFGPSAPMPPPATDPQMWTLVSRLPGGPMVTSYFFNKQNPAFRLLTSSDTLQFGESEVGAELKSFDFKASSIVWSREVLCSIESPEWWKK